MTHPVRTESTPYTAEQVDAMLAQVLQDYAKQDRNTVGGAEADVLVARAIKAIRDVFEPELKRIEVLTAERDEADRRAGAAERQRVSDSEDVIRLARVRDNMKRQWGVSPNVSFDVVWAEALQLQAQAQRRLGLPTDQESKYTTDGWHLINRASGAPIPHDEPVFIFRARDAHAREALEAYACVLTPGEHRDAVAQRIADFARFASAHPDRMKQPDTAPAAAGAAA